MQLIWPASLRARLLALVAICILPAIVLATYTAIERYHTAVGYAYNVTKLASDGVEGRYQNLESSTRDLLAVLTALPAVDAPPAECNSTLAALREHMPAYENLSVISASGEFLCSAMPIPKYFNLTDRDWFRQVLQTRRFTRAVIPHGRITHRALLFFLMPHFDKRGNFTGTVDAAISPQVLAPPAGETTLARDVELTVFSSDGTVLMQYPDEHSLVGSDQSQTTLFKAVRSSSNGTMRELPGLGGRRGFYNLRYVANDVPGGGLYIAGSIHTGLIERLAFLPLIRDLAIITIIMILIILGSWWFSSRFVTRRVRPVLQTLQRIGVGEGGVRTGLAYARGEIGDIARGVDSMAESLESRTVAQHAAENAREISEQRYVDLVEQAADGIFVRRVNGALIFVNEALCQMLGYRRDELLKMHISQLVDESNRWRQRMSIGDSLRFESWVRHRDGHDIPVEVSAKRLQNGDIQSIQHDISERLSARRELEKSEHHYRVLVENSMLGILLRRPTGEIIFSNQALCNICGYSTDELVKMQIIDLVEPSEYSKIEQVQLLGANDSISFQSLLRHKSGRILHVDVNAHRIDSLNIQIVINDISNRVQAEQKFAEERNFVFHALDTLPGVFYVFNAEGHFLRWNRQMEEITGHNTEEMQRITSADIVPPDRRAKHLKAVTEILNGRGLEGQTELYCKDGTRIPYFYVARHFEWQGQHCVVGMGVDISDQKQAEERAQTYLKEMQQLSARILETQEDERRRLARELHDELGQGLTATLLSLKNLGDQVGTGPLAEQVKHASSIITDLTQQVRALSLNLRPSVLDDLGLVAAVRWYIRERVESTGLRVDLSVDKDLPRLSPVHETACFRVLQTALTNVLRHAQVQSVQVRLHQTDGNIVLAIQDQGRGFDVKAARRSALNGKSLGLLSMEERIRLAGGRFVISSIPGQGTEVRVELPVS